MAKTGGVPGYIEDFCHVLSENQASETGGYLAWVILAGYRHMLLHPADIGIVYDFVMTLPL